MRSGQQIDSLRLGHSKATHDLKTAALALVAASVMLIFSLFVVMRSELIEDAKVQAKIFSINSSAALLFRDRSAGWELLSALSTSPSVMQAAIFYSDGEILAQYQRMGRPPLPSNMPALPAAGHQYRLTHLDIVYPVSQSEQEIGFVMLRLGLEQFYRRLASYAVLTLLVALGSLLVVYLFVSRMGKAVSSAESQLHYLAHTDPVTGLPNRHAFNRRLSEAMRKVEQEGGELGLVLLDLDNFKIVNDTLGHQSGDQLLQQVAGRLGVASRSSDIVCRIGGDEFVIVVGHRPGASLDLEGLARRVLAVLAEPFMLDAHEIFVTASIGTSVYPADAFDSETLIRNADTAMYYAKQNGKNTFQHFNAEMDRRSQKRLLLERSLRKALERQEMVLHYQPQVDVASGEVIGVEALLRWIHPELGIVSPAEFIPVAEESAIIVSLGKWILRSACTQAVAWRNAGHPIKVAVNLSARQAKEASLLFDILQILAETGLEPRYLELEITEGILMENVADNIELLQSIRRAGIGLSIDDFGTGYSSMSYLTRFPIGQLKIDRSFVSDIPGGGEAITTAVIAMAHSLGLTVVAEGVETQAQMQFLRASGCDAIQGYLFSRALPAEQLTQLLSTYRATQPMLKSA